MKMTDKARQARFEKARALLAQHGGQRPPTPAIAQALNITEAAASNWWRSNMDPSNKKRRAPPQGAKHASASGRREVIAPGSAVARLLGTPTSTERTPEERRFVAAVHLLGVAKSRTLLTEVETAVRKELAS